MKHIHLISSVVALLMFACTGNTTVEQEEHAHDEETHTATLTDAQQKNAGIVVGSVERKMISGTISVNGVLDVPPQQLVSISVPLGGFVKSTALLQGSRVKKGQRIAVIENPEYIQLQQDYLESKHQLEFAKADYERQQALARESVNAEKTLQQAKSAYYSWLARHNGLLAKLKLIHVDLASLEQGNITSTGNVYSPINGYVTEVNVNIGKYVNPQDVLFEIVDTEHLHAELTVFEKDVPKLRIGQKVRFVLANETEERMATVYLIGREISTDRTVRIHCHIDREDTEMLPGMYLRAQVEAGGALVTALPDEAIIDYQGKRYIFVPADAPAGQHVDEHAHEPAPEHRDEHGHAHADAEEGQAFTMVEVQTGTSELGYTEIAIPAGYSAETPVVVKGAYAILSKIKNSGEAGHAH